jgi:RHS repeat-associated protein
LEETYSEGAWQSAKIEVAVAGANIGRFEKDFSTSQEAIRYYYQDHLGSRIGVADESGSVLATVAYDVWGNATATGAAGYDAESEIRFTGKPMDATGLYYFNARYYDPQSKRFFTEDPIQQGMNWYAYCGNDPVNFTDPTGMFNYETGEIVPGDTLSEIVAEGNERFGTNFTVDDIAGLNGIDDPDKIQAGEFLAPLAEWSSSSTMDVDAFSEWQSDFFNSALQSIPLYLDIGASLNVPVAGNPGGLEGVFITPYGLYEYSGGSVASGPGFSANFNFGIGTISPGLSWGIGGSYGVGFQFGESVWGAPNFLEFGLSTPSAAASVINTKEVAFWIGLW